jgi:GNAT superfamily N-acetyltransferase
VNAVTDILDVTAALTHPLRTDVLGWTDPHSRLDNDADATHLAVVANGVVVAVVSHLSWPYPPEPDTPARYFWAMAVDPAHQRHGHGRRLLATLAERSRGTGQHLLWADAREAAVPFYIACGGQAEGQAYVDDTTGLMDRRVVFAIRDPPPDKIKT